MVEYIPRLGLFALFFFEGLVVSFSLLFEGGSDSFGLFRAGFAVTDLLAEGFLTELPFPQGSVLGIFQRFTDHWKAC
jgi:hypothetical protein